MIDFYGRAESIIRKIKRDGKKLAVVMHGGKFLCSGEIEQMFRRKLGTVVGVYDKNCPIGDLEEDMRYVHQKYTKS